MPTFLRAFKSSAFLLFALPGVFATEYVVPKGDVGVFFATLPEDATSVVFSAQSVYSSDGDIVLPHRHLLVIDGRGCELKLGKGSNGFTYTIADKKDAMVRTSSR
ncbi:MAG: hypothetical protein WAT61_07010, partial [Flavobacteriales bacterium]